MIAIDFRDEINCNLGIHVSGTDGYLTTAKDTDIRGDKLEAMHSSRLDIVLQT